MVLKIGNTTINKAYVGSTETTKIYLGSSVVYSVSVGSVPFTPVLGVPTVTSTTLALSWTMSDDTGVTDYIVEYKESSSGTWLVFSDGTSTTKSATITGLSAITSYDTRVKAVNGVGESAYSNTRTIFTATPFTSDSNTIWWDFRSSNPNNIVETSGSPTLAYVMDMVSKGMDRSLIQENKSMQPLVKANGIDFNKTTNRVLPMSRPVGICNGTSGWYCAFNVKPTTLSTCIMRISGASTSSSPSRGYIEVGGSGASTPQVRSYVGNNDSGTTNRLGATQSGAMPALPASTWSTVEIQVDISSGVAVMSAWVNGTAQTIASPITPTHTTAFLATNPNTVTIGNNRIETNAVVSYDGEIQQMIFYNSVPSGGIRSSISTYINGVRP